MITVNQLAHSSAEAFLQTVQNMLDIFGEVEVNIAPAFGGDTVTIASARDMDDLRKLFQA